MCLRNLKGNGVSASCAIATIDGFCRIDQGRFTMAVALQLLSRLETSGVPGIEASDHLTLCVAQPGNDESDRLG